MQAVILAAGKSTRTYPLTITRPKPLLKIANKTLLEHNLDSLMGIVSEAIIVVGYRKEMIKKRIGNSYRGIRIKYAFQKEQLGTGHALSIVKKYVKDKFLLMAGDDLYPKSALKRCSLKKYSIFACKVKNPENFGVILEKNGILSGFVEKPKKFIKFISSLASTSLYSLDKKIFSYLEKVKKSERGEIELPDALKMLSKEEKVRVIKGTGWLPIGYPWDLLKADIIMRKGSNSIGKGSKIRGKVRNSSIGENCTILGDVSNSIIMDNSFIGKNSVIENSVIGNNVRFDGKIKSKNNAVSVVNGRKIAAGKFGAAIGGNVTAEAAVIEAGVKVWPGNNLNGRIKNDVL